LARGWAKTGSRSIHPRVLRGREKKKRRNGKRRKRKSPGVLTWGLAFQGGGPMGEQKGQGKQIPGAETQGGAGVVVLFSDFFFCRGKQILKSFSASRKAQGGRRPKGGVGRGMVPTPASLEGGGGEFNTYFQLKTLRKHLQRGPLPKRGVF